jgi:hypothetical protein
MSDGRVILNTEKRAPGFYQLALRRINLDGGDYHPLYGQRGSIGYPEATQVVELGDRNYAAIFRDPKTAQGGGVLGVFNRSLGIDFQSKDPKDYPIDPGVIDPSTPQSPDPAFFLHSLHFPDPTGSARPGTPTTGLYTSPSPLPDALVLVSFGATADPTAFGGDYDVYVMNTVTGAKTKLLGDPGFAEVDAIGVYAKLQRAVFHSTLDEPNGHTVVYEDRKEADIIVLDMAVFSTIVFQNTPTRHIVDPGIDGFSVFEDMPPPLEVDTFEKGGTNVATDAFGRVYVRRRLLGAVPLETDGSAHFSIPGGVPIVLKVPDTELSRKLALPRYQREEMMFSPGEYTHQSFKAKFFNSLCGNCHSSISGRSVDVALQPDFVTSASATLSTVKPPWNLNKPPGQRGPIEGPSPTP